MFNVTGGEIVIIVLVALVVLGPERIPEVARNIGRLINKAKTMSEGFQNTVNDISGDPSMKPLKDLGELAARPRQKLAEFAAEAEAEERAQRRLEERARMEAEQARAALAAQSGDASDIGQPPERPAAEPEEEVALDAVPDAGAVVALEALPDPESEPEAEVALDAVPDAGAEVALEAVPDSQAVPDSEAELRNK
ncbi:MAG: twin-arginine translocase TatA/TatE family subunit [Microthrixaceae bacterium]